jgi:hypothetical protein
MWDMIIRLHRASRMLPVLEQVLSGFGKYQPDRELPEPVLSVDAANAV